MYELIVGLASICAVLCFAANRIIKIEGYLLQSLLVRWLVRGIGRVADYLRDEIAELFRDVYSYPKIIRFWQYCLAGASYLLTMHFVLAFFLFLFMFANGAGRSIDYQVGTLGAALFYAGAAVIYKNWGNKMLKQLRG